MKVLNKTIKNKCDCNNISYKKKRRLRIAQLKDIS